MNETFGLFKVSLNPDGSERAKQSVPVVTGLEMDGSFALSSDGRYLAYARAPYYSNLWSVPVARAGNSGPEAKELTQGGLIVERPKVSPDGKRIVFNIGREPTANLYVMAITGGQPKQLTFFNSFNVGGAWSPDGKQVAFASNEGGTNRVWVVDVDGGSPRPVSSGQLSDSFELAWAPGRDILYQQAGNQNYYTLDPNQGERLLLAENSPGWIFNPSYSSDGERIAVVWNRPSNRGIWLMQRDGLRQTLARRNEMPELISWSSDRSAVYAIEGKRATYRSLATKLGETITEAKIVRVPFDGGQPRTILALPFSEVGGVSMTPDGQTLICSVYSNRSDIWILENFDN
jgi:Tol biopolymer transport system component